MKFEMRSDSPLLITIGKESLILISKTSLELGRKYK